MSLTNSRDEMTAREREEFAQEKEAAAIQAEYNLKIKEMEIEVARMEARWSSWLKLPLMIIKLPVFIVFGIAYCIAMAVKHDPPESFWKFLK